MAVRASGSVTDRPWGMTVFALASRGVTGELTLVADNKQYRVAFQRGAVVAAHSPLASDAVVRIALTGNLLTSTQVPDITRRLAAAQNRDEIEVLAEASRLSPEQAQRLRRRVIAQRAARTFAIESGEFTLDDAITLPIVRGSELDARAIIYLGARNHMNEQRLADEITRLGTWFQLKQSALEDLSQFGFTDAEKPALRMLLVGANLGDLDAAFPTLGGRNVRAVVYALGSCGACETSSASGRGPAEPRDSAHARPIPTPAAQMPRGTPPPGTKLPAISGNPVATAPAPPAPPRLAPAPERPKKHSSQPPGTEHVRMRVPTGAPPMPTAPLPPKRQTVPPAPRAKRTTAASQEIDQLIASKLPLLDADADHFALLGLPRHASAEDVRNTYFMLARKLHPDRLSAIGLADDDRKAQRVMARLNAAFAVLGDPVRRDAYVSVLQRGGEAAVREDDARADELAMRVMRAEEVFKQGEMALRREQLDAALASFKQAVELQPNEPEYQALLVWTQFALAPDKNAVAATARSALARAADANERSPTARYYLGRIERMLGRDREALQQFQAVLQIRPGHTEAASEVRILEQRLKGRR